jgi:hypothetical protein
MGMGMGDDNGKKKPPSPANNCCCGADAEGLGNWREKETNGTLKGRGKEE